MENNAPYILEETGDFAVVFKPPKMHSAPLKQKSGDTLLEWYTAHFPPVVDLLHRLDFETHGLVLLAKNQKSFEFFKSLQEGGEFVKEYSAVCTSSVPNAAGEGFPPSPPFANSAPSPEKPLVIESYFRPFGPGRKQVRPVTEDGKKHRELAKDRGGFYRTEIISISGNVFTVRIRRGFRHQIRAHLCWIGRPILNDLLYGEQRTENSSQGILALCAHALFFTDPSNGRRREYRITPMFDSKPAT